MDCARTKVHSVGVKDFSNLIGQIASLKVDLCFWEDAAEDVAGLRDSQVDIQYLRYTLAGLVFSIYSRGGQFNY